jgi:glucose-1-phosphate cytidylyltransferase
MEQNSMKVVILCGGQGTRLREETEFRPKPMVEIGGRPVLWHIMKSYSHYGFSDFVLCLGYKGSVVREYFLNYDTMNSDCTICLGDTRQTVQHNRHEEINWRVTLVDTGLNTPKGGRIKRIQPYIEGQTFLLTYGDGLADIDIPATIGHHRRAKRIVTFTGVNPRSRFATAGFNARGEVITWKEKRPLETFVNGGFFVLDHAVFDYLADDTELEEEPMEKLASLGQVTMYPHLGNWECMDTYRDYLHLNALWNSGDAFWAVWKAAAAAGRGDWGGSYTCGAA